MIEEELIGKDPIYPDWVLELGEEPAPWVRLRRFGGPEHLEEGLADRDEARTFAQILIEASALFATREEALIFSRTMLWARKRGRASLVRRLRLAVAERKPEPVEVGP